jgi:hypothetical protein
MQCISVSPYAIHKRTCNVCVRNAGLIPPWQKESDLVFRYEFGTSFLGTVSQNSGSITHHVRPFFETMIYHKPLLECTTFTVVLINAERDTINTLIHQTEIGRKEDYQVSEVCFSTGFRVSTFNANASLSLLLIRLHSTPNIYGIMQMVLSKSKCLQKFVPLRY